MTKAFYADPFFYTVGSMPAMIQAWANYAFFTRITYRWYRAVPAGIAMGFIANQYMNWRRRVFQSNAQLDDLQLQIVDHTALAAAEGKQLERNEQKIKEVLKTVIF